MKKFLFLVFILLITINPVLARTKPANFVDYTSKLIYNDCNGKSLIINVNNNFANISWPYSELEVREFINTTAQFEFKEHNVDNSPWLYETANEGLGILKCGNNKLDILGTTYFWNDIEIIPPAQVNLTQLFQNINEKSFIRVGDINISLIGGISIISISLVSVVFLSIRIFVWVLKKKNLLLLAKS